jgi:hypothetical protein
MLLSVIGSWVVKSDEDVLGEQNGSHIAAFVYIAGKAAVSEVVQQGLSTAFHAHDRVYLKRVEGFILMDLTIFAAKIGPLSHGLPYGLGDVAAHCPACFLAFFLAIRIRCSTIRNWSSSWASSSFNFPSRFFSSNSSRHLFCFGKRGNEVNHFIKSPIGDHEWFVWFFKNTKNTKMLFLKIRISGSLTTLITAPLFPTEPR